MLYSLFCVIFAISANEVYPAIVGPVGTLDNNSSLVLSERDPAAKEARIPALPPLVPVGARAPGIEYYKVPDAQTQSLVKRLSLVRSLMERHGRAYDYREHTIADLKQKLDELDAAAVIGP
jgi:hypothetical protein